jgi:hypothetical protein
MQLNNIFTKTIVGPATITFTGADTATAISMENDSASTGNVTFTGSASMAGQISGPIILTPGDIDTVTNPRGIDQLAIVIAAGATLKIQAKR